MHEAREDLLAFRQFPKPHWRKIWNTRLPERVNEEPKRRTRVVGIFPNDAAITRLVGAVLLEQNEHWQLEGRRHTPVRLRRGATRRTVASGMTALHSTRFSLESGHSGLGVSTQRDAAGTSRRSSSMGISVEPGFLLAAGLDVIRSGHGSVE